MNLANHAGKEAELSLSNSLVAHLLKVMADAMAREQLISNPSHHMEMGVLNSLSATQPSRSFGGMETINARIRAAVFSMSFIKEAAASFCFCSSITSYT